MCSREADARISSRKHPNARALTTGHRRRRLSAAGIALSALPWRSDVRIKIPVLIAAVAVLVQSGFARSGSGKENLTADHPPAIARWLVCVAFVVAVAADVEVGLAQWPAVRSSSAPRTADGRVDLLAPAPRMPNGRPDLSGVWDKGLLPAEAPPPSLFSGSGPSRAFRDLTAALPGELPMLAWAAQLKAIRSGQNSKDHPDAHLPAAPSDPAAPASAAAKDHPDTQPRADPL